MCKKRIRIFKTKTTVFAEDPPIGRPLDLLLLSIKLNKENGCSKDLVIKYV